MEDNTKQKTTILIIDDDVNARISLAGILLYADFQVFTAANQQEAIAVLNNQPIDLVFLDINLAGENGLKLLSFMRTYHPQTAVIILTAYVSHELQQKAFQNGAHDFIIKPAEPTQLIQSAHSYRPAQPRPQH
jgi:two-component system NtrC family response regulator